MRLLDFLNKSEVVVAIADEIRNRVTEKINRDIEEDLVKTQIRLATAEGRLQDALAELRETTQQLGESQREVTRLRLLIATKEGC